MAVAPAQDGKLCHAGDERPTSLLSATTLVGPATVFVAAGLLVPLAILFRYSFNTFEPRRMMVETFSLDNYVKFFSDPYYTGVLGRRCGWPRFAPSSASSWVCRSPMCWRAPSRGSRTC